MSNEYNEVINNFEKLKLMMMNSKKYYQKMLI